MPMTPTTPPTGAVKVPSTKSLDEFHVHKLHIDLVPRESTQTRCLIQWSEGYDEGGEYVAVCFKEYNFVPGAEHYPAFLVKLAAAGVGANVYDVVKNAAWGVLQDAGLAPAGSIS